MKPIPRSITLLQIIKRHLDKYFAMPTNSRPIRCNELYEYLKRQQDFKEKVCSPVAFSRFLRKMHDENILKQFIKNIEVDTSNKSMYQWYFYPPTKKRETETATDVPETSIPHPSENTFFAKNKRHKADNGVMVRSRQELCILNRLLQVKIFDVYYERPLPGAEHEKYPDFTIYNRETGLIFHWEHFGMLDNPTYYEQMIDKLQWYKRIGYRSIDEGGKLIVTRYDNESQFIKSVENIIEKIKYMS